MMKNLILACMLLVAVFSAAQAQNGIKKANHILKHDSPNNAQTLTLGQNEFLLNGKPFLIRAGELHFSRIPRAYWNHRIRMLKAMGIIRNRHSGSLSLSAVHLPSHIRSLSIWEKNIRLAESVIFQETIRVRQG